MSITSQCWQGEGLARVPDSPLHKARDIHEMRMERLAGKLGLSENEHMQIIRLAEDIIDHVQNVNLMSHKFTFFRIGGSVSQGLALTDGMSDLDIVCFVKTEGAALCPQMAEAAEILKEVIRATPWMELISHETAKRTLSARVEPRVLLCTSALNVDFVLTHDPGPVCSELPRYPLNQPLSMREARELHKIFYSNIPVYLRSNNYDEAHSLESNVPYVRDVARSYVDCATSFARSVRPNVRHACLILKKAAKLLRIQHLALATGRPPGELDPRVRKNTYPRSYAILHLVVVIDQYIRMDDENRPSTIKELVLQTCSVILHLHKFRGAKTFLFEVDQRSGFYDASAWRGSFPMTSSASPIAARDVVNPVNDVVRMTDWGNFVEIAKSLLFDGLLIRLLNDVTARHGMAPPTYWGRSYDDEDHADQCNGDESSTDSMMESVEGATEISPLGQILCS